MYDPNVEGPRRRLGRGLSALLGGSAPAHETLEADDTLELRHVAVAAIARNPWQPRKDFDAESLGELSGSIREHGVLQPLLVREIEGGYQLIAGERRWLAAQKAGLEAVPCRVVDVIDKTACEFALEENLKRKDLSDLEKAHAFKEYLRQFECTAEELARQLSVSRSAVSNIIRLLDLTEPVKQALQAGKISSGHARALLPLEEADQLALCGRIQAEALNVRQTEKAVKELLGRLPAPEAAAEAPSASEDAAPAAATEAGESEAPDVVPMAAGQEHVTNHVRDLQDQLRNLVGAPVDIKLTGKDSGQIVIHFSGNEEFERILALLRDRLAAAA